MDKKCVSCFVTLVLTLIILLYVLELEKKDCKCAINGHQQFIKYFSPVVIVVTLLTIMVGRNGMKNIFKTNKVALPIFVIYALVNIVYVVNLIVYFFKLRKRECDCARDWKEWVLIVPGVFFMISFIIGFYTGFKRAVENNK